jgi:HEAT repeat protein
MQQSARVVLWLSVVVVSACRARAPYEGKSAAQLERMLRDPSPAVQAQGAYGLGRLGGEACPAVPSLIDALKNDSLVRQQAARALGQIGPDARAAVPALSAALEDSEWTVRRQAALALGRIGPAARPALPKLQKLSRDPEPLVRKAAQEARKQIGENSSGEGKR